MTELQSKYVELKKRIRVFDNGDAAETMRKLGINYKTIHGLSIGQLKSIARIFAPDTEFALFLWEKDMRETKLLAPMIASANELTVDQINIWTNQIPHIEVAEQMVINLLQNHEKSTEIAFNCIASTNKLAQSAGILLITKLIQLKKPEILKRTEELIPFLEKNAQTDNIDIRNAVARSLRQIGQINSELKAQILIIADKLSMSENMNSKWIAQELMLLKEF